MATTYPAGWVTRVERAPKLAYDADGGVYRAPARNIEVGAVAVDQRTVAYLKAEAARRKRRLSADDEELCRKFVLIVANWDTGTWINRPIPASAQASARRSRRAVAAPATAGSA